MRYLARTRMPGFGLLGVGRKSVREAVTLGLAYNLLTPHVVHRRGG